MLLKMVSTKRIGFCFDDYVTSKNKYLYSDRLPEKYPIQDINIMREWTSKWNHGWALRPMFVSKRFRDLLIVKTTFPGNNLYVR